VKKTVEMFLVVLKAKFEGVTSLGNGLYLVKAYRETYSDSNWGVYSSQIKGVICWGNKYERLSPDLISFERVFRYSGGGSHTESYLFSLQKKRCVKFGEYSGSRFELCENGYVKACFLKTVETESRIDILGGWGVFDIANEKFIVRPQYEKIIPLGNNQYYGIKENRGKGRKTYFLIEINDQGKVITQKTSKIA